MTSFAEFLINLFEKLGIYYVFTAIFVFVIMYVLFYAVLKYVFKDVFKEKQINILSGIFGFVTAMLSITIYGVTKLISYFLSFIVGMILVVLFAFVSIVFILEKKPTLEGTAFKNAFFVALIFVMVFMFISFYFAYQEYLLPLSYGKGGGTLAGTFKYVVKPEILIIPFMFAILGIAVMVMGR